MTGRVKSMKNHFKFFTRRRILIGTLITGIVSLSAFGWIVAHMVTRPLDVELHAHVQICQKSAKGQWEVIDEAGPENLKFSANLLELATGKKVGTDFNRHSSYQLRKDLFRSPQ